MIIEPPTRMPMPRVLVLSFMAGLSMAAGLSCRLYVEELEYTLGIVGAQERA
jgi:hypothetical protein